MALLPARVVLESPKFLSPKRHFSGHLVVYARSELAEQTTPAAVRSFGAHLGWFCGSGRKFCPGLVGCLHETHRHRHTSFRDGAKGNSGGPFGG